MEKLIDKHVELYEQLFWDLRAIYQNGQAWADNGIPFRQVIEDFMGKMNASQSGVEVDAESRCPECGETEPDLHCSQCGHSWYRTT